MKRWRAIQELSRDERQRVLELEQYGAVVVRARRAFGRDYEPGALAAKEASLADANKRDSAEIERKIHEDPAYVVPLSGMPIRRGSKPWLADVPIEITAEEDMELAPGSLTLLDELAWATGRYEIVDPEDDRRRCLMEGLQVGEVGDNQAAAHTARPELMESDRPFLVRIGSEGISEKADEDLRTVPPIVPPIEPPSIWTTNINHPFLPGGYVFVPEAFNRIGRAKFGSEWTDLEGAFRGNIAPFGRPSVVFEGDTDIIADREKYRDGWKSAAAMLGIDADRRISDITNAEWCDATDRWQYFETWGGSLTRRRDMIIDIIHRACSDGAERDGLLASIRQGDGQMIFVESHRWNCDREVAKARLLTGLIEFEEPDKPLHPFFFEEAPLQTFIDDKIGRPAKNEYAAPVSPPTPAENPHPELRKPGADRTVRVRLSTKEDAEAWYRDRIEAAISSGIRLSRDDDVKAGEAVGIGRDRVRELRRNLTPSDWQVGGRPTKKQRRRSSE